MLSALRSKLTDTIASSEKTPTSSSPDQPSRNNTDQSEPWTLYDDAAGISPSEKEWRLPEPKELREELCEEYDEEQRAKAWTAAAHAVKTYHDELIDRWNKEMDTLLVYAGLFSAVLTAFNVQSYQSLQSAPTDSTVALLQRISAQLDSFSISNSFVNSTQRSRPVQDLTPPFHASSSAVWINTLWFSSLVCSLASASIALMVKQWLHELSVGVSGESRECARRRQYRLDGIIRWRIGTIVVIIPIVLQLALVLFLAGLVILLWTLHGTVGAITSSLVGILFIFQFTVTVLPSYNWDCCYLSPQSLMIYSVVRPIYNTTRALLVQASWLWARFEPPIFWNDQSNLNPFRAFKKGIVRRCNKIKEMPTWRGQEQLEIIGHGPSGDLDRRTAVMACTTTFSSKHLEDIQAFFSDITPKEVARYLEDIWDLYERRRIEGLTSYQTLKSLTGLLLAALRHMLTVPLEARDEEWGRTVKTIVERHNPVMTYHAANVDQLLTTFSLLAMDPSVAGTLAFSKVRYHMGMNWSCFYSSVRNVMIMAEHQLHRHRNVGTDPDASLYTYLQAFQIAVRCILQTYPLSGRKALNTDPEKIRILRAHGQDVLTNFEHFLRVQRWERLEATMPEEWRQSAPFLHFLSHWLERYAILPLTVLARVSREDEPGMVSLALVEALAYAWDAAQAAYVSMSTPTQAEPMKSELPQRSVLHRVDGELDALRKAVTSASRIPE
ncbi:hypothetical protein L226DRAFT_616851 [Lentinus tigrinus ALCF2SS1-7]|uniref:uncharacterized protein n=1 Tax=Lentinus tigrinus ALCF2SS1-7 TaxID=1328758 RepID=UPI001165E0EA|nr:hypothetical protein L226DRAFT_616851 [Lentinus tigrinus ALCF2SS1-7]